MCLKNMVLRNFKSRVKSNRMPLKFTAYEMELVIKCLSTGYRCFDKEKFLFNDNNSDKENIYYLQRVLGCKANEHFYDIKNNEFFKLRKKIKS